MLFTKIPNLLTRGPKYGLVRKISTTPSSFLIQKWRRKKGEPENANSAGVLTDSPDYSFLDGRLTPLGVGQKNRILQNRETRDQIIALSGEIDFAVERHKKLKLEEQRNRQGILDRKLKPKGLKLLKKE